MKCWIVLPSPLVEKQRNIRWFYRPERFIHFFLKIWNQSNETATLCWSSGLGVFIRGNLYFYFLFFFGVILSNQFFKTFETEISN